MEEAEAEQMKEEPKEDASVKPTITNKTEKPIKPISPAPIKKEEIKPISSTKPVK